MTTSGITTFGNRTFLYGTSSGIDTSALITAAYNQRKSEADKIDVKVTDNTTRSTALSKLQTLGQAVQTSLAGIKKNYSVLATNSSLFDARTGSLSANTATDPTKLVTVSIDPATTLGSYEIEVLNKAKAQKVGSLDTFTDPAASTGNAAGTFDIGEAEGTSATVSIAANASLNDIAAAINGQSTTTGVSATVVKTTSNSYQLVISAKDTAKAIQVTNLTGADVLTNIGVTSGGTFAHEIQPAQSAQITLDGVTITRDTNNFDDLITGVKLTVKNAEPGTTLTLGVEHDTSSVKTAILSFVDAYNDLRDYVNSNQSVGSDGAVSKDAILFGDSLLANVSSVAQSLLGGSYGTSGPTDIQTLRELGITLDGNNRLVTNESTLDTQLSTNFDQVRGIFETSVTSDNPEFKIISNKSQTKALNFALDITYSGGAITSASVGGDNSLFDIVGGTITGKKGTAYDGLVLAYIGTTSTTVNVGFDQGFADLISNGLNNYTDVVTGSIQAEKVNIDNINTDLQSRSARILERADDYRNSLIDKYAKFESQIAQSQTTLLQIQAILGTNSKNNN